MRCDPLTGDPLEADSRSQWCILAGLKVQDERLAAVNGARTLPELEDVDRRFTAHAILATEPCFAPVYLEDWR